MEKTSNPFCRMLCVYSLYKPSKLTADDLKKIANKYGNKGERMLIEIEKKYRVTIPAEVRLTEVQRVLAHYSVAIPDSFRSLLPEARLNALTEYSEALDPRSNSFSPLRSLQERRIYTSATKVKALDNVAVAAHRLLPGMLDKMKARSERRRLEMEREKVERGSKVAKTGPASASASSSKDAQGPEKQKIERTRGHVFDVIAEKCKAYGLDRSHKSAHGGTYTLLARMMEHPKGETQVTVHDSHGIRGTLTGKLAAFDHHFNMIFTKVTERYRLPSDHGDGHCHHFPHTRMLRQVLVRGDTVVKVCWAPHCRNLCLAKPVPMDVGPSFSDIRKQDDESESTSRSGGDVKYDSPTEADDVA